MSELSGDVVMQVRRLLDGLEHGTASIGSALYSVDLTGQQQLDHILCNVQELQGRLDKFLKGIRQAVS